MRRVFKLSVWLGAILFLGTLGFTIISAYRMEAAHAGGRSLARPVEAIIVLGAGIDPDGVISYASRRRTRAAVEMLREGRADLLIFSGGPVRGAPEISMGALMRDFALAQGADPAALRVEPQAISTFQNLLLSFAMTDEAGLERIALLTDSYHLTRAATLAGFFGKPEVELIAVQGLEWQHWAPRYWAFVRETLAWGLNVLRMIGWRAMEGLGYSLEQRTALIR